MQVFAKDNKNVKYLMVIDVFSKYGWIIALKNKTSESDSKTFRDIFKRSCHRPPKIWMDKRREFHNKDIKSLGFKIYTSENEEELCSREVE